MKEFSKSISTFSFDDCTPDHLNPDSWATFQISTTCNRVRYKHPLWTTVTVAIRIGEFLNRLCLCLQAWIFLCIAIQIENFLLEILFVPRSFLSPCFCTFYVSFLYTVTWKIRDWRKGGKIKRGCFGWKMRSCCGVVACKIDFSCSFQW